MWSGVSDLQLKNKWCSSIISFSVTIISNNKNTNIHYSPLTINHIHNKNRINTNIEKAKFIDATGNPYDTLLDEYEKGMTSKRIDEIFEEVSAGLRPLIAEIKEKGTYVFTYIYIVFISIFLLLLLFTFSYMTRLLIQVLVLLKITLNL